MPDSERLNGFPPQTAGGGGWRDKNIHSQHTEHGAGSSCQCNKTRKGNKRQTNLKGKNKTVLICQ